MENNMTFNEAMNRLEKLNSKYLKEDTRMQDTVEFNSKIQYELYYADYSLKGNYFYLYFAVLNKETNKELEYKVWNDKFYYLDDLDIDWHWEYADTEVPYGERMVSLGIERYLDEKNTTIQAPQKGITMNIEAIREGNDNEYIGIDEKINTLGISQDELIKLESDIKKFTSDRVVDDVTDIIFDDSWYWPED